MRRKQSEIAIVGIACRFPDADNHEQFWNNLDYGINSIKEIPADRWSIDQYYSQDIDIPGKSISKWCGSIDRIFDFDHQFFNISPREAFNMDPQQRLLLEETWHCIEDSGISIRRLQDKITSVYVGVMTTDYQQTLILPEVQADSYACLGNFEGILANRISYVFDFQGTSMPINAACASSLVAIDEAKRALEYGECDYAIVSGVNLNIHPWKYVSFSKSRMLSPDGQCKTFDIGANGYVPGDGVGVLLLQRQDDAKGEGNHIYATIKGSAINHSGKTLSITAPRIKSQRDVIMTALKDADVHPETISYVEAHGTGTSLGDPIEVEALTQAFRRYTDKKQFCKIGSLKTNIGHLESAAGLAGVIKIAMMMKYKKVPQTLNVRILNPIIDFNETPFIVSTSSSNWNSDEEGLPLRAGVSSFGFGGVNAHVILEEYRDVSNERWVEPEPERDEFFILSAKNSNSLQKLLTDWKSYTEKENLDFVQLHDISKTLLTGRESFPYRYGILVKNKEELFKCLQTEALSMINPINKPFFLEISECSWTGYNDFEPLVQEFNLFKKILDGVLGILKELEVDSVVINRFFEEEWAKSHSDLYQFIASYTYTAALFELGLAPKQIAGEKTGFWVAMAITGMMSLEDILAVKSNRMELINVMIKRPSIPFVDSVQRKLILPFQFEEDYVRDLLESLNEDTWNQVQYYVNKSKLLYENQHTFKKYVDEWNEIIQRSSGYSMKNWFLLDDPSLIPSALDERKEKALLMIIIVSSLEKLNQKWDLKEQRLVADNRFYEIMELISDGVMTKKMIVDLIIQDDPDFGQAAQLLENNQIKLSLNHSYVSLRKRNEKLHGITSIEDWIHLSNSSEITVSGTENGLCVKCGSNAATGKSKQEIVFELTGDAGRNYKKALLELWLNGADMKWDKLEYSSSFRKASLPVYPFQRETFRLFDSSNSNLREISLKPDEEEKEDEHLKQLLYNLQIGELEIHEIKKLMGDA